MITAKRLLDQLGMVGLMTVIVIWGCAVLWLGGPFFWSFALGLFTAPSPLPLVALSCPLTLSAGETKTISATIANPKHTERVYLVTMAQPSISSSGSIELCHQEVIIPPGSEEVAFCLVRLDDLDKHGSGQTSWYMSVRAVAPPHVDYPDIPENEFTGNCIIRSHSSFQGALV
jgi:hypothetical protein